MKKLRVLFVVLFFLSVITGFLKIVEAAEIIYSEGKVQIQRAKTDFWSVAVRGQKLSPGDALRTAAHSMADIILDESKKNAVRIEQQSMVTLNSTSTELINRIDLSSGKIYARIESLKSGLDFEVSTPSAVVGVRGTGWAILSRKNSDQISVYENKVFVKVFDAQKKTIFEQEVNEGFKVSFERFKAPEALALVAAREMRLWNEVSLEIKQHIEEGDKEANKSSESSLESASDYQETIKKIDEAKEQAERQSIEDRTSGSHTSSY